MKTFLQLLTSQWFSTIGTIFTILGVNLLQPFDKPYQSWLIIGILLVFILFSSYRIYLITRNTIQKQYPHGYLTIASFLRYSTLNGKDSIYEHFRHIQVKTFYKNSFEHIFHWTGSYNPQIESELQEVSEIKKITGKYGETQHITYLTPTRCLIYNECDILHTKAICENDNAKPFLSQNVNEPIKFINFKVELFHAKDNYKSDAKIEKQPIDKPNAPYDTITTVPFDFITKSFTYTIIEPEAGFKYKIEWEKPKLD